MPHGRENPYQSGTPSCRQPRGGRYSLLPTRPSRNSPSRRSRREICTGEGAPASLGGPSQGATRRPTARSATAHAREGSSEERCGMGGGPGRGSSPGSSRLAPRLVTWTGCASQDPYRMALVAACPVRSPRASPRRARPATTTLVLGSVYCNPLAHRGQSLNSGGVRGDRASSASHGPSTKWFVLSLTQSTSTSTPRHIRHPGRPHRTHLIWGRHNT
jgi:hypothetical protein